MGFKPVEFEIGGESTTVLPDPGQQLASLRSFPDLDSPSSRYLDFDIVAFPKVERLHHYRR
jgi:hypothetical protein